jgi:hypothetical protein
MPKISYPGMLLLAKLLTLMRGQIAQFANWAGNFAESESDLRHFSIRDTAVLQG